MVEEEEIQALVFDNGSGMCKAGLAGDDAPRAIFPSACPSSLKYAMEHGFVSDWDIMEELWDRAYCQLSIHPEDHNILVTEAPLNPRCNREKMAEILYETFGVPALYFALPYILSGYASGRPHSGVLILDIGDTVTHIGSIYDGHTNVSAICRYNFGGRDLTNYLMTLLLKQHSSLSSSSLFPTSSSLFHLYRPLKEKMCYVSSSSTSADEMVREKITYSLPGGDTIQLGSELYQCPEVLFRPHLMDILPSSILGIHECLYQSLMKLDIDYRYITGNIVIAGGTTLLRGFRDRLELELTNLLPSTVRVRIIAPPERKYSVWIGGTILASWSMFQSLWVEASDYEECGPMIVHTRCQS